MNKFILTPNTAYKARVRLKVSTTPVNRIEVNDSTGFLGACDVYNSQEKTFVFYTHSCENIFVTADFSNIESFEVESLGESLQDIEQYNNINGVYIAMATIPSRACAFKEAVESLIEQADKLLIYLNGYATEPDFIRELHQQGKVDFILDPIGASAAAAKFFWAGQVKGYYFTCDDDIIYPSNYVEKTIAALNELPKKTVVAYHGKNYRTISTDIRLDRTFLTKFEDAQSRNLKIEVLGTGVCAFHSSILNGYGAYMACLHLPRSMDLAFSMFLRKKGIKKIVLKRNQGWLKANTKVQHGLNEQKQLNKRIKNKANDFLIKHNPMIENKLIRVLLKPEYKAISLFLLFIFKNKKVKKLCKQPKQFVLDMKIF